MLNLYRQPRNLAVICLALIVAGPNIAWTQEGERPASDDPRPAAGARTYVGTVKDLSGEGKPNPQLGIVVQGEDVLAYACSKSDEFNQTHSRWLRGKIAIAT